MVRATAEGDGNAHEWQTGPELQESSDEEGWLEGLRPYAVLPSAEWRKAYV